MNDAAARSVVEALYVAAADPEGWRDVIDALQDEGSERAPTADAQRGVAHAAELARRIVARERATAAEPLAVGRIRLTAEGRVVSGNEVAWSVLGAALAPRGDGPAAFASPEVAEAIRDGIARVRARPALRVVVRLEVPGDGARFGYIGAGREAGTYDLTLPGADAVRELWSALSDSFGLTPAEVRVAALLREGRTLREIAEDLELSIHTVRNQLRSIFDKLGVQRQSDLIRALSGLAPLSGAAALSGARDGAPRVELHRLRDGRTLAYRDYGVAGGPVLMMFHEGLGSSLLPQGADALARQLGLRVICPERPGFGRSDPREDYGFDVVAEDAVELCDALGLERVRLGAILSGAPFAVRTAVRLGDRAEEILLCSGRPPRPARGDESMVGRFRRRLESAPWVAEGLYAILRLRLSSDFVRRLMRAATAHTPDDRAFVEANPWVSDYIAAYVEECVTSGVQGVLAELRAFRRAGNATADGVTCPVVVWHGEDDRLSPLNDLLDYLGDRASDVSVAPGMGHLLGVRRWRDILHHAARP